MTTTQSEEEIRNQVRAAAVRLRETGTAVTNLPWRSWRTPYRIFLAEFLLVRTRSDVVAARFEEIYRTFSSVKALAAADEEVLAAILYPLGMRKRAPLLLKAARHLIEHHNGEIPQSTDDLLAIPGIGAYTSSAIAAFAFGMATVPADVNILRFLARLTALPMEHVTKGSAALRELLPLLSSATDGPSVEVLLDFTRLICKPRRPLCVECRLQSFCHSVTVPAASDAH